MFAQADWSPNQSPEAISRTNTFINRAYSQLMLEAPFLFFESEVHLATEPDVSSKSDSDTIQIIADNNTFTPGADSRDPWTWETTFTATTAAANTGTYNTWKYDRSWDGRTIEITLSDGSVIRNQIRTIWKDTGDDTFKMTLVQPFDYATNGYGGFKYRIVTEEYALPDDLVEVKSGTLRNVTNNYPLSVMGQDQAERMQLVGPPDNVAAGIPRTMFRRNHLTTMNPATAPFAAPDIDRTSAQAAFDHPWKGPEPPGEFQYIITYSWGKRDVEFRLPGLAHYRGYAEGWSNENGTFASEPPASDAVFNAAANRYREPRFESAPSPASEVASSLRAPLTEPALHEAGNPAIKLTIPNIEYALGFLVKGTNGNPFNRTSLHQSGIHVRIYRKRLSASMAHYNDLTNKIADGSGDVALNKLDIPDVYFLLAEFRLDETNKGIFYDNGEIIPDYSRRLRDIHGYQSFGLYPRPDKKYTIDLRCLRRPDALVDDSDVPLVHAEATNVLISRALMYLYESMGNHEVAMICQQRYDQELLTLSKRYGDLRPSSTPVLRRLSRARYSRRGSDFYRKWYDSTST